MAVALCDARQLIFQASMDLCEIPLTQKTSTIIPIPKKSNPISLNDFGTVSLTSVEIKCLENIDKTEAYRAPFGVASVCLQAWEGG